MSGYRARGPETWRLEEQDDGTFDVYQGRTRRKAGVDYIPAYRYIRANKEPHHKVIHVEPDGYENNITKSVK